jgi:hypothetical protein
MIPSEIAKAYDLLAEQNIKRGRIYFLCFQDKGTRTISWACY